VDNDKFTTYHVTNMRKTIAQHQKHIPFGISFPPALRKAAVSRSHKLEMPLSKYIQRLVEADLCLSVLSTQFTQASGLRNKPSHRKVGV